MLEAGVYRPVEGPITVRGPADWIRSLYGRRIDANPAVPLGWFLPRNHFQRSVNSGVDRFGAVRVVVERRRWARKCDTRCQQARSEPDLCECVCLGFHHGDGWSFGYTPPDTTLVLEETAVVRESWTQTVLR